MTHENFEKIAQEMGKVYVVTYIWSSGLVAGVRVHQEPLVIMNYL